MSLNCRITQGVEKACGFFPGGVKYVALANLKDISVSIREELGGGVVEVEDITISDSMTEDTNIPSGERLFKAFEVADQTGVATSAIQVGGSRDAKSILHTVGGQMIGLGEIEIALDPLKPDEKTKLPAMLGDEYANFVLADVVALVKQNDGKVILYGWENGLKSDNFDYTTGTAETDLNGITFQFSGTQYMSPIMVVGGDNVWDTLLKLAKA